MHRGGSETLRTCRLRRRMRESTQPLDLDRARRGRGWPLRAPAARCCSAATCAGSPAIPEQRCAPAILPPGGRLGVRSADGTQLHAEGFGARDGTDGRARPRLDRDARLLDLRDPRRSPERASASVAYDLRGHGDSDPAADGDYAIERFGEDLEAVLATAASPTASRAVVAGHSLGAMSIAAWAEHHDVGAAGVRRRAAQHRRR